MYFLHYSSKHFAFNTIILFTKKQLIWVFEWRKSVQYWWSYILFSPECKELTSMLDPLLYRWGVPPVVIRCVHWTMQIGVLQTWIKAQGIAIVMILQMYKFQTYIGDWYIKYQVNITLEWMPEDLTDVKSTLVWLGAVKQQAATWISVDQDLQCHMAPGVHNKLNPYIIIRLLIIITYVHWIISFILHVLNTFRPRQNGCHFADGIFKCIYLNKNVWISIKISFKFVPKGPINNIPGLIQIMAWCQPGDNPLSEPMMVKLLRHI